MNLKAVVGILLSFLHASYSAIIFTEDFNSATADTAIVHHDMERWGTVPRQDNVQIPGWTIGGAGTDILVAPEDGNPGNLALWLNETGDSFITRTITGFDAGQVYTLSFEHWGDNVGASSLYDFGVTIDGNTTVFSRTGLGESSGGFATENLQFTASGSSITLTFADIANDIPSALIDNLAIAPVPEPATVWAVSGICLLAIFTNCWRRRTGFAKR